MVLLRGWELNADGVFLLLVGVGSGCCTGSVQDVVTEGADNPPTRHAVSLYNKHTDRTVLPGSGRSERQLLEIVGMCKSCTRQWFIDRAPPTDHFVRNRRIR